MFCLVNLLKYCWILVIELNETILLGVLYYIDSQRFPANRRLFKLAFLFSYVRTIYNVLQRNNGKSNRKNYFSLYCYYHHILLCTDALYIMIYIILYWWIFLEYNNTAAPILQKQWWCSFELHWCVCIYVYVCVIVYLCKVDGKAKKNIMSRWRSRLCKH